MSASQASFKAIHPPVLFSVAAAQAFSGSTTSDSSTSSYASAYLDRLSGGSSSSAYLTDITPPITPIESKTHDDGLQTEAAKLNPQVLSSAIEQKLGERNEEDAEATEKNPFEIVINHLSRTRQTINSRRALEMIERRRAVQNEVVLEDDEHCGTRFIVTDHDHNEGHVMEDSRQETLGIVVPSTSEFSSPTENLTVQSDDSWYTTALEHDPDIGHDTNAKTDPIPDVSPRMPPKPVLVPIDVDSDCSPLSIGSYNGDFSSAGSLSHLLASPIPIEAHSMNNSSPVIYSDSSVNGHSSMNSPPVAISSLMYSSRISHRPHDLLTGENLDLPSLIRLEIAASVGEDGLPSASQEVPPVVGLGFDVPLQVRVPPQEDSFSSHYEAPFEQCTLDDGNIDLDISDALGNSSLQNSGQFVEAVLNNVEVPAGLENVDKGLIVSDGTPAGVDKTITGLSAENIPEKLPELSSAHQRASKLAKELSTNKATDDFVIRQGQETRPGTSHIAAVSSSNLVPQSASHRYSFHPRKRLPHPSSHIILDDFIIPHEEFPLKYPSVHLGTLGSTYALSGTRFSPVSYTVPVAATKKSDIQLQPPPPPSMPLLPSRSVPVTPLISEAVPSLKRSSTIQRSNSMNALLNCSSSVPELQNFLRSGFSPGFTLGSKQLGKMDYLQKLNGVLEAGKSSTSEPAQSAPSSSLSPHDTRLVPTIMATDPLDDFFNSPSTSKDYPSSTAAICGPSQSSSASSSRPTQRPNVPGAAEGSYFVEGLDDSPEMVEISLDVDLVIDTPSPKSVAKTNLKSVSISRILNFTKRLFPGKLKRRGSPVI